MTAAQILGWLNTFGRHIEFQQLPPSRKRKKNQIILQFVAPGSEEVQVVGGRDLYDATRKAIGRCTRARSNEQEVA